MPRRAESIVHLVDDRDSLLRLALAEVLVTQPEMMVRVSSKPASSLWYLSHPAGDKVRRGARDLSRGEKTICVSASGGRTAAATRDPKSLPQPRARAKCGPEESAYIRAPLFSRVTGIPRGDQTRAITCAGHYAMVRDARLRQRADAPSSLEYL